MNSKESIRLKIHKLYDDNYKRRDKIFTKTYTAHIGDWYAKYGTLNKKNYKECYTALRRKLMKGDIWRWLLAQEVKINKLSRMLNKKEKWQKKERYE